jgi:hypothetical protein
MSRHPFRNQRTFLYVKTLDRLTRSAVRLDETGDALRVASATDPHLNPAERKALIDYAGSCHAIRDGLIKLIGGEHEQVSDAVGGAALSGARVGDDRKGV